MQPIITFLINSYLKTIFHINISGLENIPQNNSAILCANHTSNFDPLILNSIINREIIFIAKQELFNNKLLAFLLKKFNVIPVNRNKTDLKSYKQINQALKNQKLICIFIQGTRKKNNDFSQAKNGAAMFSIKTNSPIIPISIKSSFKPFSQIKINIGQPITFNLNSNKLTHEILNNSTSIISNQIQKLLSQ